MNRDLKKISGSERDCYGRTCINDRYHSIVTMGQITFTIKGRVSLFCTLAIIWFFGGGGGLIVSIIIDGFFDENSLVSILWEP